MFPNVPVTKHMGCMHQALLAWLTSPRIGLARLACTSNNSSGAPRRLAAEGGRAVTGEPSKARPGTGLDRPLHWPLYLALGPLYEGSHGPY